MRMLARIRDPFGDWIRLALSSRLPARDPSCYVPGPPATILVREATWLDPQPGQQFELVAREACHHLLKATYPANPRGLDLSNAWRQEERGRRLALRALVCDRQVMEAYALGDSEVWELAERWGRTEAWCKERVALFFIDHPELRRFMRPDTAA